MAQRPLRFSPALSWCLNLISLRAALEGVREESAAAIDRLLAAGFSDPEGWYYLGRLTAYAGEHGRALEALRRSVEGGCFVLAVTNDPWLEALRGDSEFERLAGMARERHQAALEAEHGRRLLAMK